MWRYVKMGEYFGESGKKWHRNIQKTNNSYLTKQTQLSIPEIAIIVKQDLSAAVPPQNFLNCKVSNSRRQR